MVADGRYQLLTVIGSGAFGKVYKARSLSDDKLYALKRAVTQKGRKLLRLEADNLFRLAGVPHVLPLHEHLTEANGAEVLVTKYLDGGTLRNALKAKGALKEQQAVGVLYQIVQALWHAHSLKPPLLHRDLKPDNIIAERLGEGRVKWYLADWGLARSWKHDRCPHPSGTTRYAAPEIWNKKRYPVSDVFALGMTFYFMLFGTVAIRGNSEEVIRVKMAPGPITIPESCSPRIKPLLVGMLEKDPTKRWSLEKVHQTVEQLVKRPTFHLTLSKQSR